MADKKGILAMILAKGKPSDESGEEMPEMESVEEMSGDDMGLEAAAQELIDAVGVKDAAGVASALRNAFSILESQPHEEGEHIGE